VSPTKLNANPGSAKLIERKSSGRSKNMSHQLLSTHSHERSIVSDNNFDLNDFPRNSNTLKSSKAIQNLEAECFEEYSTRTECVTKEKQVTTPEVVFEKFEQIDLMKLSNVNPQKRQKVEEELNKIDSSISFAETDKEQQKKNLVNETSSSSSMSHLKFSSQHKINMNVGVLIPSSSGDEKLYKFHLCKIHNISHDAIDVQLYRNKKSEKMMQQVYYNEEQEAIDAIYFSLANDEFIVVKNSDIVVCDIKVDESMYILHFLIFLLFHFI
jgi:hypothetical protein